MKRGTLDRFTRLGARALASGARNATRVHATPQGPRLGLPTIEWEAAGDCQSPVTRERLYAARKLAPGFYTEPGAETLGSQPRGPDHSLIMDVRCRRCPNCLRARATVWAHRAAAELAACQGRSWFGTLTLKPDAHFQMRARADVSLRARGTKWEDLTQDEQFSERHREIGAEVTKWLKRVRKQSGCKIRYLLVVEPHTGKRGKGPGANLGLPHYHILIHEVAGSVGERVLRKQWLLG